MTSNHTQSRIPVILVTGASSGLGLALARLLMDEPYHLILTARQDSLARFREQRVYEDQRLWLRPLDITDSEQREAVIHEADEKLGGVDVLVNNAGIAYRAVVEHVDEKDRMHQMNVNFRSPIELARLVLPGMRKRRHGRIINISSASGMMAMPTMAVYSASKFALEGATESLYYESRPWNIKVTLIEPGFINSLSVHNTQLTRLSQAALDDTDDPYHSHYLHMSRFISRFMKVTTATPHKVARVILKTIRRKHPPLRVAATWDAWLFSKMRRFLPRRLYHEVLYRALPGVGSWGKK